MRNHKSLRRLFCLLLPAVMLLSGCGGSAPAPASPTATAAPAQSAAPAAPPAPTPPPYNTYDYAYGGITVGVPLALPAEPEDTGSAIVFSDPEGAWTLRFTPETVQMTELEAGNIRVIWEQNRDFGYFKDVSLEQTSVGGYDALCLSLSRNPDWDTSTQASSLMFQEAHQITLVDYGEKTIAGWGGLMIELSGEKTSATHLTELLADPDVQILLNHLSFYAPSEGRSAAIPGISVTVPARWGVGDNGKDTLWTSFREEYTGNIYFGGSSYADPKEAAAVAGRASGDVRTLRYGDRDYDAALRRSELEEAVLETLELYTAFTDNHALQVKLSLAGADAEALWAFAGTDAFRAMMESLELDPAAYQEPEADRRNADGFECNTSGELSAYNGTETDLVLPAVIGSNEIVGIDFGLFKGNTALRSVEIPEGVIYIESDAFRGCTALERVTLPNSLTYIDTDAFADCEKLRDVRFGEALVLIDAYAFENCASLGDVKLPDSIQGIGSGAFKGAGDGTGDFSCPAAGVYYDISALANSRFRSVSFGPEADLSSYGIMAEASVGSVTIGLGCQALGDLFLSAMADSGNEPLTVTLNGVKQIGAGAFEYRGGLTAIDLSGVEVLGEDCFMNTGLTAVTIPGSVKGVPAWAFGSCTDLMTVTLEEGVEVIHENAFNSAGRIFRKNCYLTLLTEEQAASFGGRAVPNGSPEYDRALSITLPSTLRSVEAYAFAATYIEGVWMLWCTSVEELPDMDPTAFSGCWLMQVYFTKETIEASGEALDAWFNQLEDAGEPCWYYENQALYWSEEPLM